MKIEFGVEVANSVKKANPENQKAIEAAQTVLRLENHNVCFDCADKSETNRIYQALRHWMHRDNIPMLKILTRGTKVYVVLEGDEC